MNLRIAVRKSFPGFTLEADFSARSSRVGVFGRSGSGKSTLVHLIAGMLDPDAGSIELDGETLCSVEKGISLPPESRRVAVVFQAAHLFPHLNVRSNLYYGFKRTARSFRRVDPGALVEILELGPLMNRHVNNLSGGERQRVALGRAVLASPRLLLMDEPLSALDEGLKYQIIPYLAAVYREFKIPYLFISHSMNEMRLMTDEVVVLHHGRVSDHTSPEDLARERMGWTRAGYINLLRLRGSREEDGMTEFDWGGSHLLIAGKWGGGESVFELSSKDIVLFKQHPEAISARNLLSCRVASVFGLDGRVGVELDCGGDRLIAQVVSPAVEELGIREGAEMFAVIKASAFRRLY